MSDRISVTIAVPRDVALPIDVQGVGLRRMAIDLMQTIARVDENSVRYEAASDDAVILFGDGNFFSTWQHNALTARFYADGEVFEGVGGPVIEQNLVTRVRSMVTYVRDGLG